MGEMCTIIITINKDAEETMATGEKAKLGKYINRGKSRNFGMAQKLSGLMGALDVPWPVRKKQNFVNIRQKPGGSAMAQKLL